MAASKLQIHVFPLPDQISTKFSWLYLCFRGPAFHWDSWDYNATKPEGEKSKMVASKLQIHISLLPNKISTKFQRLHLYFRGPAFHWNSWKYYATKPEVKKCKMAASKLLIHISPLPDKISTTLKRLHLCFQGPAFHWDS